jgi:hypothetical protein
MSGVVGKVIPGRSGSLKSISAGTLDYVLDGSYEPDQRQNREIIEGLISKCLFFSQSPKFILNGLLNLQIRNLLWVEMWAAAKSLAQCRAPIKHFMFSTKDRVLSHQEFDQASKLISETLGVNECLWVSSAHRDTKNFHIHFVVVTEKLTASDHELVTINNRWTWRACQRVCARLCHEFKIQPLVNSMFEYRPTESNPSNAFKLIDSNFFLRTQYQPNRPIVYREKDIKVLLNRVTKAYAPLPENVIQYELRTGRKSLIRLAQKNLTPHLQRLLSAKASWSEMHRTLHALGWEVIPKGVGQGVLVYGSKGIKLSSLGNQFSMNKLEQTFGPFEPASNFGLSRCLDFGLPIEPVVESEDFYEYQAQISANNRSRKKQQCPETFIPYPRSFQEFKLGFSKSSSTFSPLISKYLKPKPRKVSPYVSCMKRGDGLVYFDMRGKWPKPLFIDTGYQIQFICKERLAIILGLLYAQRSWPDQRFSVVGPKDFHHTLSLVYKSLDERKAKLSKPIAASSFLVEPCDGPSVENPTTVKKFRQIASSNSETDTPSEDQENCDNDDEQGSGFSI